MGRLRRWLLSLRPNACPLGCGLRIPPQHLGYHVMRDHDREDLTKYLQEVDW